MRKPHSDSARVLLYDGVCSLCSHVVQTVLKHDKRGTLRFAALQSNYGQAVKARHPGLDNADSFLLLERSRDSGRESVFVRSIAALRLAAYLGGIWKLFLVGYIIPRPIRDSIYAFIARHRYRIFGKRNRCFNPSAAMRSRFLDVEI